MLLTATISRHLRLMLTAITLLCVVALNHREVTTYVCAPEAHQVHTAAAERHSTVKEKVSLEAPHAYLVLEMVAGNDFVPLAFIPPVAPLLHWFGRSNPVTGFFKIFLSGVIQAMAP